MRKPPSTPKRKRPSSPTSSDNGSDDEFNPLLPDSSAFPSSGNRANDSQTDQSAASSSRMLAALLPDQSAFADEAPSRKNINRTVSKKSSLTPQKPWLISPIDIARELNNFHSSNASAKGTFTSGSAKTSCSGNAFFIPQEQLQKLEEQAIYAKQNREKAKNKLKDKFGENFLLTADRNSLLFKQYQANDLQYKKMKAAPSGYEFIIPAGQIIASLKKSKLSLNTELKENPRIRIQLGPQFGYNTYAVKIWIGDHFLFDSANFWMVKQFSAQGAIWKLARFPVCDSNDFFITENVKALETGASMLPIQFHELTSQEIATTSPTNDPLALSTRKTFYSGMYYESEQTSISSHSATPNPSHPLHTKNNISTSSINNSLPTHEQKTRTKDPVAQPQASSSSARSGTSKSGYQQYASFFKEPDNASHGTHVRKKQKLQAAETENNNTETESKGTEKVLRP